EVYKLINTAQLLPNNRPPRVARLSDVLVPQDAIQTASRSKAELLFNEGAIARVGANSIFRFVPGMRSFQLRNGNALIMSPPTTVATRIETLDGQAIAEIPPSSNVQSNKNSSIGSIAMIDVDAAKSKSEQPINEKIAVRSVAMLIHVDAATNKAAFLNLTNNPIKILDTKGNSVVIRGGDTVTVQNGAIGQVQVFDLKRFLETSSLANGLAPGQEKEIAQESPRVQQTLNLVRVATIAAINLQLRQLEGLCTLNARGGASTLSTNCITTNSDDPLRAFQDWREISTPRPEQAPPVNVPVETPPVQTPPVQTPPATNPNNPIIR
ncbi:MAG: hypothetical protein C4287_04510, partial [Leptolyngbya sp. ERB_1_2]